MSSSGYTCLFVELTPEEALDLEANHPLASLRFNPKRTRAIGFTKEPFSHPKLYDSLEGNLVHYVADGHLKGSVLGDLDTKAHSRPVPKAEQQDAVLSWSRAQKRVSLASKELHEARRARSVAARHLAQCYGRQTFMVGQRRAFVGVRRGGAFCVNFHRTLADNVVGGDDM